MMVVSRDDGVVYIYECVCLFVKRVRDRVEIDVQWRVKQLFDLE